MKRILSICLIAGSLFATPPCEFEQEKICMYLYNYGLVAELNIANTTDKKIMVNAVGDLDGKRKEIKNFIIEPYQTITLLKSRYESIDKKPNVGQSKMNYVVLK
ncbi:MAG: hypothetical protein PHW07_02265 [Sulfurospirillaceae bacterium]|nr:hypothetical protein [Sulfurospirillaceae bacterium]